MEEINQLMNSEDEWTREKGILLAGIQQSYSDGHIDHDQYMAMLEDIKNTDLVADEASSMENKALVLNVVNAMSMVV